MGWAFALFCSLSAHGDGTSTHVVDCGANKAVPFDETVSPDGRAVIGWTLLAKNKAAKPIDWTLFDASDPSSVIYKYISDPDEPSNQDNYVVTDCVIDLKDKSLVVLPGDHPFFPNRNHSNIEVSWSPLEDDRRYALIDNVGRFSTSNLWLISLEPGGVHQVDLIGKANAAIEPIVHGKRPQTASNYLTLYSLAGDGAAANQSCFSGSTATLSFDSEIPKAEDDSGIEGTLTIHLPDGAITHASGSASP